MPDEINEVYLWVGVDRHDDEFPLMHADNAFKPLIEGDAQLAEGHQRAAQIAAAKLDCEFARLKHFRLQMVIKTVRAKQ